MNLMYIRWRSSSTRGNLCTMFISRSGSDCLPHSCLLSQTYSKYNYTPKSHSYNYITMSISTTEGASRYNSSSLVSGQGEGGGVTSRRTSCRQNYTTLKIMQTSTESTYQPPCTVRQPKRLYIGLHITSENVCKDGYDNPCARQLLTFMKA